MMIRSLMLALVGFVLAGSPALASTRDERPHGQQPQARAQARAAAPAARPVRNGQRSTVRRAAPVSGQLGVSRDWRTATASTSCVRSRGVTRCRGQSLSWSQGGWARGLEPAANVQANECPAGTMATLARGHDDVVRCMPI